MRFRIILFMIVVLVIVPFIIVYMYKSDGETILSVDVENKKEEEQIQDLTESQAYEPIPIVGSSGMLFETYDDAKKWAEDQKLKGYEIKKCDWKWEYDYKKYGLDGEIYYTVEQ